MARPIKNNCTYFSHDADMRNHRKVKAIRKTFTNGYAIWSMFLEYLTAADGNTFENSEIELELIAGDFGFLVSEIRDVLSYCIKLEMLFENNGFISSESLNERLAAVYLKRGKARELSKKQLRNNGKYTSINTEPPELLIAETPQRKVKESKEDKIKVNNEEDILLRKTKFTEILKPFTEKYGAEMMNDFFRYWTEKNEGGKKMRFEMEKVFEIKKRLATWQKNQENFKKNGRFKQQSSCSNRNDDTFNIGIAAPEGSGRFTAK